MSRFTTFGLASLAASCALVLWLQATSTKADDVTSALLIGGGKIDVIMEPAEMKLSQAHCMHWVRSAAEAVVAYYGRYPVPHVLLRIIASGGSGVRHGQTFGYEGGLIKIRVGNETQPADLANDWMLTHEMVHLAFPSVAEQHHWIEEGIAVYVEPIARIQARQMSADRMWADLVRDMPKGLPQQGDQGLDHTHTWGRTYWGGALFCLLADVEIRKQTNNERGLQDALRGILNAGGDIRQDWELLDALKAGDHATGTNVLITLYDKMKDRPMDPDLPALWQQLGIQREANTVRFVDDAPLAALRRSITAEQPSKSATPAVALNPVAVFVGRSASR
jgi:hypothetical protein